MIRIFIKFIFLLLISLSGQANALSPSETAQAYFTLLKQKDYSSAIAYYDPVALSEFRQLMSFAKSIPDVKRQVFYRAFFEPDLTDDSNETLSDSDYFASFLRGVLDSDTFSEAMNFGAVEILGEIKEDEGLVHVVIRNKYLIKDQDVEVLEVATFKQVDGKWMVQMSGRLKAIALSIRWDIVK